MISVVPCIQLIYQFRSQEFKIHFASSVVWLREAGNTLEAIQERILPQVPETHREVLGVKLSKYYRKEQCSGVEGKIEEIVQRWISLYDAKVKFRQEVGRQLERKIPMSVIVSSLVMWGVSEEFASAEVGLIAKTWKLVNVGKRYDALIKQVDAIVIDDDSPVRVAEDAVKIRVAWYKCVGEHPPLVKTMSGVSEPYHGVLQKFIENAYSSNRSDGDFRGSLDTLVVKLEEAYRGVYGALLIDQWRVKKEFKLEIKRLVLEEGMPLSCIEAKLRKAGCSDKVIEKARNVLPGARR